eukprot:TRINITY_DN3055_c0_g1_i2.p1 TRINITY_DN3055_c0_g1~~TRINITY_DN3055_c0_g1_i2.p1  ORF type:complete len:466 (+),score=73.61 TRINITY_DN3055_c0_g1_i2:145-1542(+)
MSSNSIWRRILRFREYGKLDEDISGNNSRSSVNIRLKLLFFFIYFSQNAFLSYYTFLNSVYLRANGYDYQQIGVLSFVALLPLIVKTAVGYLSDYLNRRKIFIAIGLILQIIALVLLGFVSPAKSFAAFLCCLLLAMVGVSFYDTTTDGYAVSIARAKNEEGSIQSYMGLGNTLGNILVTGILGIIADKLNWSLVFWTLAILTLPPLILLFFSMNEDSANEAEKTKITFLAFLKAFFNFPVAALSCFSFFFGMTVYGSGGILFPFIKSHFDISLTTVGLLNIDFGIGMGVGILAAKYCLKFWIYPLVIFLSVAIHTLTSFMILSVLLNNIVLVWFALFALGFGWSYRTVVFFSASMHFTKKEIAASMYSVVMAFANLGIAFGNFLNNYLVSVIDFNLAFLAISCLILLSFGFIPCMFGTRLAEYQVQSPDAVVEVPRDDSDEEMEPIIVPIELAAQRTSSSEEDD